jgi:AbrB family looped-hinge helix DNA binding protein
MVFQWRVWDEIMPFPKWAEPLYDGKMNSKVTLDRAGRVVLPKTLRDEMNLSPGDTLDLTVKGDEVTLRPRRGATPLQKERGVWVFRTGKPVTADETGETLRDIRAQRHRRNAGQSQ